VGTVPELWVVGLFFLGELDLRVIVPAALKIIVTRFSWK
jgi:hypothetical protein